MCATPASRRSRWRRSRMTSGAFTSCGLSLPGGSESAVAVTTIQFDPPKAKKLSPLRGFGAQFNTNLFTTDGESTPLSNDERRALLVTIKNEVNSYDIAKAGQPQKSMALYDLLYRDLRDSLRARPDPVDSSKTLAQTTRLVGGDLVEHGPGHVVVNKERVAYGPSNQN